MPHYEAQRMDQISLSVELAVDATQLYKDWLDSDAHSEFTGGEAVIDPFEDGRYTAWDGYIEGVTLEVEPHTRVVQSWRTLEFPDDAPHSTLEVKIEAIEGGARLSLNHSNIPSGDGLKYRDGWNQHYFEPMKLHYGTP